MTKVRVLQTGLGPILVQKLCFNSRSACRDVGTALSLGSRVSPSCPISHPQQWSVPGVEGDAQAKLPACDPSPTHFPALGSQQQRTFRARDCIGLLYLTATNRPIFHDAVHPFLSQLGLHKSLQQQALQFTCFTKEVLSLVC